MVSQNSGRLEGLAQGLDFYIETVNPENENSKPEKTFGFQIVTDSEPTETEED